MIELKAGMRAVDASGRAWIILPNGFTEQRSSDCRGPFFLARDGGWNQVHYPPGVEGNDASPIVELYAPPDLNCYAFSLDKKHFGRRLWSKKNDDLLTKIQELKDEIAKLEAQL